MPDNRVRWWGWLLLAVAVFAFLAVAVEDTRNLDQILTQPVD